MGNGRWGRISGASLFLFHTLCFHSFVWAVHDPSSINFDFRKQTPSGIQTLSDWRAQISPERLSAKSGFESTFIGSTVDLDPDTLVPHYIRSTERFLTLPSDLGPIEVVRRFIASNASLFGVTAEEVANSSVRIAETRMNELLYTSVHLQQFAHGIPIKGATLRATLTSRNELVSISSGLVPRLDLPVHEWKGSSDKLSQFEATLCGTKYTARRPARLVYFPITPENIVPAFELFLREIETGHFSTAIHDLNGQILFRENLTHFDGGPDRKQPAPTHSSDETDHRDPDVLSSGDQGIGSNETQRILNPYTFKVFADSETKTPFDSPTPLTPGYLEPSTIQPALVSQALVTPIVDPTLSPLGWVNESHETIGNNIDAFIDWDAYTSTLDAPRPKAVEGTFLYTADLFQSPQVTANASVVNLFYVANWFHDQTMKLGFTEEHGNFQHFNLSGKGLEGDRLLARVQVGTAYGMADNAYFSGGLEDGEAAEIGFFLFTGPDPDRDSALDNEVAIHELAHGLFARLASGGWLNEGNSDFFALSLLSSLSDDPNASYPFGGFISYWLVDNFEYNYYSGIRRFPYSTQFSINPLTYSDVAHFDAADSPAPVGIVLSPNPLSPHNVGEVWATMLWQVRANLINSHGPIGNWIALQLVTDGLKLGPAYPLFVQGRDAILLADQLRYGGIHRCEIWNGFAARGLGYGAIDVLGSGTLNPVDVFDTHPSCL